MGSVMTKVSAKLFPASKDSYLPTSDVLHTPIQTNPEMKHKEHNKNTLPDPRSPSTVFQRSLIYAEDAFENCNEEYVDADDQEPQHVNEYSHLNTSVCKYVSTDDEKLQNGVLEQEELNEESMMEKCKDYKISHVSDVPQSATKKNPLQLSIYEDVSNSTLDNTPKKFMSVSRTPLSYMENNSEIPYYPDGQNLKKSMKFYIPGLKSLSKQCNHASKSDNVVLNNVTLSKYSTLDNDCENTPPCSSF